MGREAELQLGDGTVVRYRVRDLIPVYRPQRTQLQRLLDDHYARRHPGGDFYLATSGGLNLATGGYFLWSRTRGWILLQRHRREVQTSQRLEQPATELRQVTLGRAGRGGSSPSRAEPHPAGVAAGRHEAGEAHLGAIALAVLAQLNRQGSDADDGQEAFEPSEVIDVARVEREVGGRGGGSDQQIEGSGATRLAPRRDNRGVDASIGPRRVAIERQRIEAGFGSLQAILTSCSLADIGRRVRAGGEFSHGKGADCEFHRELLGVDVIQIDHDRGVNEPLRRARSLSHEARSPGWRPDRDLLGTGRTPPAERP